MSNKVVISICFLLLIGVVFLTLDIKNAYKIIPIKASPELEVPAFSDWHEYGSTSESFKVSLPAPPQSATESIAIPNTDKKRHYEMYVSEELNGSMYMVSLITYPDDKEISNSSEMLKDTIDEIVQGKPGNKIKKMEDTFFQSHKAIEFNIVNSKYNVEGVVFMLNRTVFLLSYIASDSNFNRKDYDHFIKSFKLKNHD